LQAARTGQEKQAIDALQLAAKASPEQAWQDTRVVAPALSRN